jgi:hypothetical protein
LERLELADSRDERSEALERLQRLQRTDPGGFVLAGIKPVLSRWTGYANTSIFSRVIETGVYKEGTLV